MRVPKINPFKTPEETNVSPLIEPVYERMEEEEREELRDSEHFNFNNNMYYLTSYQAKMNVYRMQKEMLIMLLLDVTNIFLFGFFYPPFYSFITFLGIGLYGVWKFRPNFVICYQLYIMAGICLRIYTAALEEIMWKKIVFGVMVPSEFYFLYRCWYYVWEIKSLNSYDRKVLRGGWRGNHNFVL